jgi:hypothetical protein
MKSYTRLLLLALAAFFTVAALNLDAKPKNNIKLNDYVFKKGQEIVVKFTTQKGLARDAWIGIIPSNVKHGSEAENDKFDVSYLYLEGKTAGTLKFTAPMKPGAYDMRMHSTDNNGVELYSVTFVVK